MKALQAITDFFKAQVANSGQLEVWAEDGELQCTQGTVIDGFIVEYVININISAAKIEPQKLMMHLVNWLNQYDINRPAKSLPMPSFAIQPLDNGLCDVKIKLDMSEEFSLIESDQGEWEQNGVRYECVSDFEKTVHADDLPELVYLNIESRL